MGNLWIPIFSLLLVSSYAFNPRPRRSIDLTASNALIPDGRLPEDVVPNNYTVQLKPNFEDFTFKGIVKISVTCNKETNQIQLHAHSDLEIDEDKIRITDEDENAVATRRIDRPPKRQVLVMYFKEYLKEGARFDIEIEFKGKVWENAEGLFRGKYLQSKEEKQFMATYFRPNNARKVFPCFDEPSFKVPFSFSVWRPNTHHVLFNVPLDRTEELDECNDTVIDYFETTPPMSTYTFGFVISELSEVMQPMENSDKVPAIRIWGRRDVHKYLANAYSRIQKVMDSIKSYWDVDFPLAKLDIVALPGLLAVKPADNWGLIVFKEAELQNEGYYNLAQELSYQWLGSWVTPAWWSDAHVNKAIAGFLSASVVNDIDSLAEFEGKWPMTILYSIYYEFSKRYPHSRITAMKQETTCSKTELVLRMINYTIGSDTFKKGLQNLLKNREFSTFHTEDVWEALRKQAHLDTKLCESATIKAIAESWITKDRIPVVQVCRNYDKKSASVTQKVYLRERPHDVPEQDKMLWWIPLVMVTEDKMNFSNTRPYKWMKNVKEMTMEGLPAGDKFIIINPEEIGPFPVNYDKKNWNLLANYLQTEEGRKKIPVYTRAKLLHDAWNLAYAGELSFATALNMTLFMKYERNHLVWHPVFTLIDHIGRHIDMSAVHKKFENYVRILLTPLYEELIADTKDNDENWKINLKSLSKTFLCRAGYKPCIEEAQSVYKKWMDSENPDLGNPVANQYICPVFKWGTQEEWEFGLQRIINFPESRKQSERTYLLKTLAGCPIQAEKVNRLLNLTILEDDGNFTDNDIGLIFKMLSGGSGGYTTLFNFLQNNWDAIKLRFKSRESLWDNLINAATGSFTTQEGYNMVSALYVKHQGEFGTAEHIIEKSLKNIKEETKWSDENLPVIEKWLDNFLSQADAANAVKFMG